MTVRLLKGKIEIGTRSLYFKQRQQIPGAIRTALVRKVGL